MPAATLRSADLPSAQPGWQRLLAPVVDPMVFDFWAQRLNPVWSWAQPLARVVERIEEAPDTVTLVLAPNRHVGPFQPGQHMNLTAEVQGRRLTRSYSLTGIPRPDGRLSFTIKRMPGGLLSTHLVQHTRVGDVLGLGPAFGDMVLPRSVHGRWLFLAAGSGITPLIGLTRALAARQMPVNLQLLYWVRQREELCFVPELKALAARHPHFRWQPIVTEQPMLQPGEVGGLISAEQLSALVPDLVERQVHVCGPGGFVATARELTEPVAQRFVAEGFTPPPVVAPTEPAEATTVQVHLQRSGRTLAVRTDETLLQALEAQGLNPPSGCRMGICHTCSCPRVDGRTQDSLTGELTQEATQPVRLCVSRACTNLTLDL